MVTSLRLTSRTPPRRTRGIMPTPVTPTAACALVRHRRPVTRPRLTATLIAASIGLALPAGPATAARADGLGTVAGNLVQLPTGVPRLFSPTGIGELPVADGIDDTGKAASRLLERELR
ncbi:hypothetical protein SMC26_23215 [Actinomadura fulvescens]|uniref:Uncharacterized protein n=1 Tax=Actinomadura fulvescens TaxID=46160 RepID=A0ABP6DAF9_9ACTN